MAKRRRPQLKRRKKPAKALIKKQRHCGWRAWFLIVFGAMALTGLWFFLYAPILLPSSIGTVTSGYGAKLARQTAPKTANLFLKTPITPAEAKQLAQWDIVILGAQAQTVSPEALRTIRRRNPNAVILAYVLTAAVPRSNLGELEGTDGLWHALIAHLTSDNYVHRADGAAVEIWPGMPLLNLASLVNNEPLPKFLADFWYDKVLRTGLWDGLFFDNAEATISHVAANADLNGDGRADDPALIDRAWQVGLNAEFGRLRLLAGDAFLIAGNGRGALAYAPLLNGLMLESFPNPAEGAWADSMNLATADEAALREPKLILLHSDTGNTGTINFRFARFSMGSAILLDAWHAFDFGSEDHSQLWRFPEYALNLGQPLDVSIPQRWESKLYKRQFDHGTVIVNPTDQPVTTTVQGKNVIIPGRDAAFIIK